MIKQLAHVCIRTLNLDETLRFYTEILGLEKGFDFVKDGRRIGYYIRLGNRTFIEVFQGDPGDAGNISHMAIEVEDMDGLIERLQDHGVAVGEKKRGADDSWQVWIKDPNGIGIEFQEYTAASRQLTGGKCIVT